MATRVAIGPIMHGQDFFDLPPTLKPSNPQRHLGSAMSDTIELDRASNPQAVRGYAFYDWGKSAFETSTTVAILPAWNAYLFLEANGLTTTIGNIDMTGDAVWAYAVAAATLLVAILAPAFGVMADKKPINPCFFSNRIVVFSQQIIKNCFKNVYISFG